MRIEARQRIATWNRASKRFACRGASAFRQLKAALNSMTATIDLSDAVVNPGRPSEGITHPADFFCTSNFCKKSTA